MNISIKQIDRLCRWHRNNGSWALQLESTRNILFAISLNCSDEVLAQLNSLMEKIGITLVEVAASPPKKGRKNLGGLTHEATN